MDRKTFTFKPKVAGGRAMSPPNILEIELTDDDTDDEDFTSQPPPPPSRQTSISDTSASASRRNDDVLPLSASSIAACPTNGTARPSVPTGPRSANARDQAKEGWRTLMARMQTSQKTIAATATAAAITGPGRGRKRIFKNPLPARGCFPSKVLTTNSNLLNPGRTPPPTVRNATPTTVPKDPPKGFFPIGSGFKGKYAGTTTTSSSVTPFTSSFNQDDMDFSNVIGWEAESDSEVIELNEAPPVPLRAEKVSKRACPFYKKIPGTRFAVDAFSYGVIPGVDVYLLSHFHSDHYMGLTKNFSKTVICDNGTGNLVRMKLGVDENCIRRLQLNRVYSLQGVKIVLITANHCPGSVMFILRLPDGTTVLHTGDFRFTSEMLLNPFLASLPVDALYLDTTYCNPKYVFPRQMDTISQVVSVVKERLALKPQTLILCGAYCIGKERVFFSLAEAIGTKVFCVPDKLRMLEALENPNYNFYLSPTETGAQIHVVPMRNLHVQFLSEYLVHRKSAYTHLIAIKPSGWEFSGKGGGQAFSSRTFNGGTVTVIGLPYSEHSSFFELEEFVRAINPKRVQPTVGVGNEEKRNEMMGFISSWLSP